MLSVYVVGEMSYVYTHMITIQSRMYEIVMRLDGISAVGDYVSCEALVVIRSGVQVSHGEAIEAT